jgi:hypothetical protein
VVAQRAAIETIERGYDKFLIVGAAAENNVRVGRQSGKKEFSQAGRRASLEVATTVSKLEQDLC